MKPITLDDYDKRYDSVSMKREDGILEDCEELVRRKILWDNAQKLYKVAGPSGDDEAKRAAVTSE